MIKLGYFSDTNALGGSEVYLRTLLDHVDLKKFEVFFFCPSNHPLIPWVKEHGDIQVVVLDNGLADNNPSDVSVVRRPPLNKQRKFLRIIWSALAIKSMKLLAGTIREILRLKKIFRINRIDILHFNDTGCEPPVIAARLAGVPHIVGTYHVLPSYEKDKMDWVRRVIEYGSMHALHKAISVSKAVKIAWMKRTKVRSRKIEVIYNGVDLSKFRALNPTEIRVFQNALSLEPQARIVAVPARLHPMKGHQYLIEAIPQIKEQILNVKFLFIGDGPLKEQLAEQAKALNVLDDILFLGFRRDIYDLIAIAELVVLPSVALEALAYVLIEAQALSKPVVATNFSGLPEVVRNGVTGILVPREDPKALADAIIELLNDRSRALKMGQEGRKRVEHLFTQEQMLEQTFGFYEELCIGTKDS